MQGKSRSELYRSFMDYIAQDIQRERKSTARRMFMVFIWSFVLPAGAALSLLILTKLGVLPYGARPYLDWIILIFPVTYGLYLLSSEVLVQLPAMYRKGGIATTLRGTLKDSEWRERVIEGLGKSVEANEGEWKWLIASFTIDLEHMRHRTRYLTALSGAVFYLLMQGIDSMGDAEAKVVWVKTPVGFVESSSYDWYQFIGLGLFLTLFYLSGMQTYHSLTRYLQCAKLLNKQEI